MSQVRTNQPIYHIFKPSFIVGFFLIAFLFFAPSVHAATYVHGTIAANTTSHSCLIAMVYV